MKTYLSLRRFKLTTSVVVEKDGKKEITPITFDGGFTTPYIRNGIYKTKNEQIQKAIKESRRYGVDFVELDNDGKMIDPDIKSKSEMKAAQKNAIDAEKQKQADALKEQEEALIKEGYTIDETIKKFQDAKNFLIKNFPDTVTPDMVSNKEQVLEQAKLNKVIFKNFV